MTAAIANTTLTLRPYQAEALDTVYERFMKADADASWRQLLAAATGLGKTVIFAGLLQHDGIVEWMSQFPSHQQKVLVIAHREELLDQAARKILWANPHLRVDIEQADRKATPFADVVVASIQTLASRKGKRLANLDPEDFRIVIVDEAHHATATSYQSVLRYFGFLPDEEYLTAPEGTKNAQEALKWQRARLLSWDLSNRPDRLLLGVTATPKRGDNVGLEAIFQDITFHRDIRWAIRNGYLCKLRAFKIDTDVDLDGIKRRAGDFEQEALAEAVNTEDRNALAVKAWGEKAYDRQTVAFCANVAHSYSLAETFIANGVKAEAIHGGLPPAERKRILSDFSSGKLTVITNCALLVEGWDEPTVSCIIQARPTSSSLLYTQIVGRGTRLHKGKDDCIIIDLVDVTSRHQLSTAPDLVGLPANFDCEGEDLETVASAIDKLKEDNPYVDLSSAKNINEVMMRAQEVDLFAAYDTPELEKIAVMPWMKTQEGNYRLSFPGENKVQETLEIRRDTLGKWEATLNLGPGRPATTFDQKLPDLGDMVASCEQWVRENRPESAKMKSRGAAWQSAPATVKQLEFLQRLKVTIPEGRAITGDEASKLIDLALFHQNKRKAAAGQTTRQAVKTAGAGRRWVA